MYFCLVLDMHRNIVHSIFYKEVDMIDLNKIRSLQTLEAMKCDLTEFLNNPEVLVAYNEEKTMDFEDYETDKEAVIDLLAKVENRIKSLGRHLEKVKES
jgi:hypothetical protein